MDFKNTDVVFVSGPMTGLPNYNYDEFNRVTKTLRDKGEVVLNPAEIGVQEGWEWRDYLVESLKMILNNKVTKVITLDGWENSKGARLEIHTAKELGAEVIDAHTYFKGYGLTYKN